MITATSVNMLWKVTMYIHVMFIVLKLQEEKDSLKRLCLEMVSSPCLLNVCQCRHLAPPGVSGRLCFIQALMFSIAEPAKPSLDACVIKLRFERLTKNGRRLW